MMRSVGIDRQMMYPLDTMKSLFALLSFFLLANASLQAQEQQPVGTKSEIVDFALLGGQLTNTTLSAYEGGIVVLYYYTPW